MDTFKFTKYRKSLFIVLTVFVFLIIIDIMNYRTVNRRNNALVQELKIGSSVEETIEYLQTNKERLHISHWRYTGNEDGNKWYPKENLFIHIDAPFSLYALLKESESAWYVLIWVDRESGKVEEIR